MPHPPLQALLAAHDLKNLPRAGWVRVGIPRPESVADHSWGLCWLTLLLLPPHLDRARALAYATLHDLPEVHAGDITPSDGIAAAEKARREHHAMAGLSGALGRPDVLSTWEQYERQQDDEARFVRQLDRVDMALQALQQHRRGATGMAEFVRSAQAFVTDPLLVPLVSEIAGSLGTPTTP